MAFDSEFKRALSGGKKWAEDAPDNAALDAGPIQPVLDRALGFPASYSQSNGNVPDRRRINQIFRELYGAAFEVRMGISPYDREVDYPISAITQAADGNLYRALIANGPGTTHGEESPLTSNQTAWAGVSGGISVPDSPFSFDFDTSEPNALIVRWKDGRDNGAKIDSYLFQYSTSSSTGPWIPASPQILQFAERKITGVPTNTRIYVRAKATNSIGSSVNWLTDDTGEVITGTRPGGGNTLNLLAVPGDAQATLTWVMPSDGGNPITRYIVQWRASNETFTAGKSQSVTGALTTVVTSLTNGVNYFFRVTAENRLGEGPPSNIAQATPQTAALLEYPPVVNAPVLSTQAGGIIDATTNLSNSTIGLTADVDRTEWQIRRKGSSWPSNPSQGGKVSNRFTGNSGGSTFQIRYRVHTSANPSPTDWSPESEITARGAVPDAPISVSGAAWWRRTSGGLNSGSGLRWIINPGNDNGSPIDLYWVKATIRAGFPHNPTEPQTQSVNIGLTTTKRDGTWRSGTTLNKGYRFTIFARARNANGWGPWTESQTLTVGGD